MKRWVSLLLVLLLFACTHSSASAGSSFAGFARVEQDRVNVRNQPNGDRIHWLNTGDIVFVREEKKDSGSKTWYLVNVKPRNGQNKTGWIRGDMLKLSRDIFTGVKKIAVGPNLIAVLKNDGTVAAMGEQYPNGFNPDTIHWQNITDIAAGTNTVLGVTAGGGLVGAGNYAQTGFGNTPDAAKVYMRGSCFIVMRKDGTVFTSTDVLGKRYLPQNKGASALPAVSDDILTWFDALAISGGRLLDLYTNASEELGLWSNVKGVAFGEMHRVLLMQDGTVRAFGENHYGTGNVSGWTDIVQVACGAFRTMGLKSDGTVVATGYNGYGECDVSGWRNIVQVECANRFTVGLTADGQVLVAGEARFDYEQEHDELYNARHEELVSLLSQARELDKGYE